MFTESYGGEIIAALVTIYSNHYITFYCVEKSSHVPYSYFVFLVIVFLSMSFIVPEEGNGIVKGRIPPFYHRTFLLKYIGSAFVLLFDKRVCIHDERYELSSISTILWQFVKSTHFPQFQSLVREIL